MPDCKRKRCTTPTCTEKPISEFGINDGYPRSKCKACTSKKAKANRAARKAAKTTVVIGQSFEEDSTRERAERVAELYRTMSAPVPSLASGPNLQAFDLTDAPEVLDAVAEHRLRVRVRELEGERKRLIADLSDARAYTDLHDASIAERATAATIAPREHISGLREGTALILASDWHIEEEVRPEQVAGRNRYNLEISARRMERFFQAARWAIEFNRGAFKIRDAVLWLGGDLITNYLHEDNVESNLLSPVQAIAYAYESVRKGIDFMLEDPKLERLVVPCNDGNHGRLTDKTRSATRVANSIEWLLYRQLADAFKNDPRVEFVIAEGEHLYLEIYGRTVRFLHGDSVRYGGGVGGVTIPIYKALSRWDTVRRADLTCLGHFHQYTQLRDLIINGSLIGYGPYSLSIGARFEPPAQAFTILEPRRFNSVSMPLWVSEVEDDQAQGAA